MEIRPIDNCSVHDIAREILAGKTVIYPTETCYGLGCDATNQGAVDRLFSIKQRQADKPMLVLIPSVSMARELVVWDATIDQLAEKYWPGPLTIVAEAKLDCGLATGVLATDHTIAFRITDHPFAAALAAEIGRPLVSTSANISSQASPYSIAAVEDMFAQHVHQPDIVIDAGELAYKNPSTIVRVDGDTLQVVRQGEVVVDILDQL